IPGARQWTIPPRALANTTEGTQNRRRTHRTGLSLMSWAPHVTVATVVERQGRFLLVREQADGREVYNQPAGHLEQDETLVDAAERETLEETGWSVSVTALLSIGLYQSPLSGVTYLRHTFVAEPLSHHPERNLDEGILAAEWLSHEDLLERHQRLRSPMVLQAIRDYRK